MGVDSGSERPLEEFYLMLHLVIDPVAPQRRWSEMLRENRRTLLDFLDRVRRGEIREKLKAFLKRLFDSPPSADGE